MPPCPDPNVLIEHRSFMVAVARDLLRDVHQAEDVAQDGLLAALLKPPPREAGTGWFAAVARNLALMRLRSGSRRTKHERRAARPEVQVTPDQLARIELQRRMVDAVLKLDEPYRSTVIARYLEEQSVARIADAHGVGREAVRTRLRRALAQLRARLDAEHDGHTHAWTSLLVPLFFPAPRAAATTIGVTIMFTKSVLGTGALAALLVALLFWQTGATKRTERVAVSTRSEPARSEQPNPEVEELLPPVDLDRVDRERDLHGRVVDSAGVPVAGARLEALNKPWSRTDALTNRPGSVGAGTRSGRDGTFRLALRRGQLVNLRVAAAGFADSELRSLQAGERTRIVLTRPAALTVTVLDHERRPIVGASIHLVRYGDGVVVDRRATSASDGRARIAGLPRESRFRVVVTHPLHGATLDDPEARAGDSIEVVLPRGALFEGVVVDGETGRPIEGARVGMSWMFEPVTLTDKQGRFRINGQIGGDVYQQIHVLATGYARGQVRVGATPGLRVSLGRETLLRGRVVTKDGQPIEGARIAAMSEEDPMHGGLSVGYATSGRNGRFEVGGLSPGRPHSVSVMATGFGRVGLRARPRTLPERVIDAGEIVLREGLAIEGIVSDPEGAVLARYEVTLRGPAVPNDERADRDQGVDSMLYERTNREQRRTDDLGRFRFPDLGPGRYQVTASRKGGRGASRFVDVETVDVLDVTLDLDPTRTFTVHVQSDTGEPVRNAYLLLQHDGGRNSGSTGPDGTVDVQVKGRVHEVRVVHVFDTGEKSALPLGPAGPVVNLPADATEARVVMTRWGRIAGRVLQAGKPVVDAVVTATWAGGSKTLTTNTSGKFRFSVPPDAKVTVKVIAKQIKAQFLGFTNDPSLQSKPAVATAGDHDLVLAVARTKEDRAVTVTVRDPEGAPLVGITIGFWPRRPGRNLPHWKTDKDGSVRLEKLPAREISIYAVMPADALYLAPRQVKLHPDGQVLSLGCRKRAHVLVRVIRKNREPAPGARVRVTIDGEFWHWDADSTGRYEAPIPADATSIDFQATWDAPDGRRRVGKLDGYRVGGSEAVVTLNHDQ